jgi:hypothetical protein
MRFAPGNVVSIEDVAAAVVKRAVDTAPQNVSKAALWEALVRAGALLLHAECGWREATIAVLGAASDAIPKGPES